jgi:hypothetical protein
MVFADEANTNMSLLSFAPPPPATITTVAAATTAAAATKAAASYTPAAASSALMPTPTGPTGRKRRADGPGLDHAEFGSLTDARSMWTEYVGPDGRSGLRRRNIDQPHWRTGNKPSRQLYNDKCFFYREIAWQAQELGSLSAALDAMDERRRPYDSKRYGAGWTKLLKLLETEQRTSKDKLNRMLDDLAGEA